MRHAKIFGLLAAAVIALTLTSTASGTQLTGTSGAVLGPGTVIRAEAEGPLIWHPPIGTIECSASTFSSTVENAGGSASTVGGSISSLTFEGCNGTYHVLNKGSLEFHTGPGAGSATFTSTGTRLTTTFNGFHCIFETNGTDLGTVTGSATTGGAATLDIEATIPRVGGSSGFFCGSTTQLTGSYRFTAPTPLNID